MSHPARTNIIKPFRGQLPNFLHPVAKGLIGMWLYNEYTGTAIFNLVNGVSTSFTNPPTWNGGLDYDGVNDYAEDLLSNHGSFSISDTQRFTTMAVALFRSSTDRWSSPFGFNTSTSSNDACVLGLDQGNLKIFSNGVTPGIGSSVSINQFHTFTMKHTGNRVLRAYIDGIFDYQVTYGDSTAFSRCDQFAFGGRFNVGGAIYFDGVCLLSYCWDRDLSDTEIMLLHRFPYIMFA